MVDFLTAVLILSGRKKTLPNTLTLLKLSRAIWKSMDSLIGEGTLPDHIKKHYFSCSFQPDGFIPDNSLYEDTAHKSASEFSVYICNTIPEYMKTEEVLRCELGERPEIPFYASKMLEVLKAVEQSNYMGIILCDSIALDQMVSRTGIYRGLSQAGATEQLGLLRDHFQAKFPMIQDVVVNYLHHDVSTAFITQGNTVAVTYMGGYLSWQSRAHVSALKTRIDNAIRKGCSLETWLSEHADT